jgi:type II secretory pathway pseudopilin PulG
MELLVVIAIIGILASVVLASLNTARNKGADASVKSSLNNARAQAELYYDNNSNSYTNVCTAATGISQMVAGANAANGAADNVDCDSSSTEWAVQGELVTKTATNATQYYCVDWSGKATVGTAQKTTTATACP